MTQAYRIVDWKRRYEVTNKGRAADENTPTEELRKSALDYVRSRVYGHSIGPALHNLIDRAYVPGEINEFAAFGLFHKLLELAADQQRKYRGWILDKDQRPMGAGEFAKLFRTHEVDRVQQSLNVLCHPEVGWLELTQFPGESGKVREVPAVPGLFKKETETEVKENLNEKKASDCLRNFSDSADVVKQARQQALMQVLTLLRIRPDNPSDITTFRDIFDQIERGVTGGEFTTEIFDRVLDEAKEAAGHRFGRTGRFINAMKRKPFGYIPERRQVTGSKFGKY